MRQTREYLLAHGVKPRRLAGMTWRDAKWERRRAENSDFDPVRPEAYEARLRALIMGLSAHMGGEAPPLSILKAALEEIRPGIIRDLFRLEEWEEEEARADADLSRELSV